MLSHIFRTDKENCHNEKCGEVRKKVVSQLVDDTIQIFHLSPTWTVGGMVEIQLELLQLALFQGLSNLQHTAQSHQKVLHVDNPPERHVIGKK